LFETCRNIGLPLGFQVSNKFSENIIIFEKKRDTKHYNNPIFDVYLCVSDTEEIEYELQIARMNFLRPLFCVTK